MPNLKSKKAQVTLFIILAIIIVALAFATYFIVTKTSLITTENDVETYFRTCVDEKVKEVVSTAELQGGYLELPVFEPGSEVFPFSNYFNFLALDIPYWYYVSGNGIQRVQHPEITQIEDQFADYLKPYIKDCTNFEKLNKFSSLNITYGDIENISIKIMPDYVESSITMPLTVKGQDVDFRKSEHKINTKTSFGSLYNDASTLFEQEKDTTVLEQYSLDIIHNYAPVEGLEISCVPKIWQKSQVQDDLKLALQENIQELKVSGSDYSLAEKENKYFVIDSPIKKQVNFLYLKNWPTKIDVWPNQGALLKAEPIGDQASLGFLGFCLIPYHFVYDASFPVLIQVSSGTEIFQFPVLVVIEKMSPRNLSSNETNPIEFDICSTPGQLGTIFTNSENNPIASDISYRCLKQTCEVGKTNVSGNEARLTTDFPKCVNGYVVAKSEGYKEAEVLVSTNEPFILSINLEKLYNLSLELNTVAGESAIISFNSTAYSTNVIYPQQRTIEIPEGNYNVRVQIYKQSELSLGTQETEKCISVPASGIPGMMGITTEQCYNLTLPASQLANVPTGGGYSDFFVTSTELKSSDKIKIQAEKFDVPKSAEEVIDVLDFINLSPLEINLE